VLLFFWTNKHETVLISLIEKEDTCSQRAWLSDIRRVLTLYLYSTNITKPSPLRTPRPYLNDLYLFLSAKWFVGALNWARTIQRAAGHWRSAITVLNFCIKIQHVIENIISAFISNEHVQDNTTVCRLQITNTQQAQEVQQLECRNPLKP